MNTSNNPKGHIRYVLLVVSLPTEPTPAQTFEFLNKILPELETQQDGSAKIGTLWEPKAIEAIDMTAKAVEAFGRGVADKDRYVSRTLTLSLSTGGVKCLVVYDKEIAQQHRQSEKGPSGPTGTRKTEGTPPSVGHNQALKVSTKKWWQFWK